MSTHTKYMQEMLDKLDNGYAHVVSPDKLVSIDRKCERICGKITQVIYMYHYGTEICKIAYNDSLNHVGTNGRSFVIGEGAYSPTDARLINQLLEKYVPGFVAHSRKGEVIVD